MGKEWWNSSAFESEGKSFGSMTNNGLRKNSLANTSNGKSFEEVFGSSFDNMPLRHQIETAYDYYDKPQSQSSGMKSYTLESKPMGFAGQSLNRSDKAIDYSLYGEGFDKEFIDQMENDARFQHAMESRTRKNEGGYANHPNDRGGATNYGITSRFYPNEDIEHLTPERASAILYRDYWLKPKMYKLPDEYADIVFDNGVNQGQNRAIKHLQNALSIKEDGLIGPDTLDALSKADDRTKEIFKQNVKQRAKNIAKQNPSQEVFLDGWINRADDY